MFLVVVESTRAQLRPQAGAPHRLRQPPGHPTTSSELTRLMEDAHDWQTKSGLGHSLKLTLASLPRECRSSFCRNCGCCDLQRGNACCLTDVPTSCRPQRLELMFLVIIIIVLRPYTMLALPRLTLVCTHEWLGRFCQSFLHLHQNRKEMWLSKTINDTVCLHFGW